MSQKKEKDWIDRWYLPRVVAFVQDNVVNQKLVVDESSQA